MHHSKAVDSSNNKLEMISFYNATKNGVYGLDKMCSIYSSGRRTQRWPLALFFILVGICSVNAFVIYKSTNENSNLSRFLFIKQLAQNLINSHLNRRMLNDRIPRNIWSSIAQFLKLPEITDTVNDDKLEKRKVCHICPS